MRIHRFVLDTNVWVSFILTKSEPKLLDALADGKITLIYCDELIQELTRVLSYPQLKKYHINIQKSIAFVKTIGVDFELKYPIKRYIPEDIEDDYVVALALQSNAGFITSGDSHILSEKENLEAKYKKLKILTKAEFEKLLSIG